MPDLDLLHRLEAGRRELLEACLGLTDEQLRLRPSADDWSVLEVLAHLPDVDRNWLANVQMMLTQDSPTLPGFDDAAWKAAHAHVNQQPAAEVFADLRASHAEALAGVGALTDADLARTGIGRRGSLTVKELITRYSGHDANHANQIREIRAAIGCGV
mgnify:CR=1 FL=1